MIFMIGKKNSILNFSTVRGYFVSSRELDVYQFFIGVARAKQRIIFVTLSVENKTSKNVFRAKKGNPKAKFMNKNENSISHSSIFYFICFACVPHTVLQYYEYQNRKIHYALMLLSLFIL